MNPFKFKDSLLTQRAEDSERAAPCPDVARLVSADRLKWGAESNSVVAVRAAAV